MSRIALLAFGVFAYACFLAAFAAGADFVAGAGFLRGIDAPAPLSVPAALAVDVALLALFGVSHSVMARPAFKRRWTKVVPHAAERSVYVLVASLFLGLAFWQWRALPESIAPIWNVTAAGGRAALWALEAAGFLLAVASTFLTDHFDLFGLRQVWLAARGRPYEPVPFKQRALYRVVRHPMMLGLLIVFWAAPTMAWDRALFAIVMSAYIAIGITFEERDLERTFGESYGRYRREVPAVIPMPPALVRMFRAAKPPTPAPTSNRSPDPG
jgi:protein-S-isoprenylcysteine O-methyltransferase Ste14